MLGLNLSFFLISYFLYLIFLKRVRCIELSTFEIEFLIFNLLYSLRYGKLTSVSQNLLKFKNLYKKTRGLKNATKQSSKIYIS